MAHEQSETVGGGLEGLFRNVYGSKTAKAGQTLPPKMLIERDAYRTVEEAEAAAKLRSLLMDESTGEPRQHFGLMDLLMRLK